MIKWKLNKKGREMKTVQFFKDCFQDVYLVKETEFAAPNFVKSYLKDLENEEEKSCSG